MEKYLMSAVLLVVAPSLFQAQSPASVAAAEGVITGPRVLQGIADLSDDSTMGRATPSPGLDRAARYVANEFRRFGLRPAGDGGGYFQHYPLLRRQIDFNRSHLLAYHDHITDTARVGQEVNILRLAAIPRHDLAGSVTVFSGPADSLNPFAGTDVRGSWVGLVVTTKGGALPVPPWLIDAARAAGALGALFLSDRPEDAWAAHLRSMAHAEIVLGGIDEPLDSGPALGFAELRDAEAARLLKLDVPALRTRKGRSVVQVEGVTLRYHVIEVQPQVATAANVAGWLQGSDPHLKSEYVVFSAHLDHLGTPGAGERCFAEGADSICNGADDDASGSSAVLALAEAFSRLSPPPRRSVLFLTFSGEEEGHWGSRYYVRHPIAPVPRLVADLQSDMIGRNSKDTVAAVGMMDSDLGSTLVRVSKSHPELDITPVDDPREWVYQGSDHLEFAQRGVPAMFFFSGFHPDYHRVSDEVSKIDAEKTARIVQLEFFLGLSVANASTRPVWNEARYRAVVLGQ